MSPHISQRKKHSVHVEISINQRRPSLHVIGLKRPECIEIHPLPLFDFAIYQALAAPSQLTPVVQV
jgi:hypothetical protein